MPVLFLSLLLFIASPILLLAIGLKSKLMLVIGLIAGLVYAIEFWVTLFPTFLNSLRAHAISDAMESRLRQLWAQSGPERTEVKFWVYPDSQAEFKVWVTRKVIHVFFSQGFLGIATDEGLKLAFESLSKMDLSDIKLQNKREGLTLRFTRLKGTHENFRFWFLSFWLYPLERWLKIAKI